MATLAETRKKAKKAGLAASVIRSASSASELEDLISEHTNGSTTKSKARSVVKKAVKKSKISKPARKATTKAKPATKAKAATKTRKQLPATRKAAKRTASASAYVPKGGRNLLDGVDFTETDGWNAREGSAPDRIVKALKRFKGNREKVFDFLVGDIWDFVNKRKANGEKNSKAEAEAMLRYRISRTAWDFAVKTGQHEAATNRVEYGTGGTGEGTYKPKKKTTTKAKPKAATAPKKRGRPAKVKPAVKAKGRPTAKRGRPKAKARR